MQKTVYSIKYIVKNSIEYRVSSEEKIKKEKKYRKRGQVTFLLQKVASPLFCFNGANPTLPSFQRVLPELLRSAENNIPGFADSEW